MHVCAYTYVCQLTVCYAHSQIPHKHDEDFSSLSEIEVCGNVHVYTHVSHFTPSYYIITYRHNLTRCHLARGRYSSVYTSRAVHNIYFKEVFSCSLQIQFDKSPPGSLKEPASQTPSCSRRDLGGQIPSCSRRDLGGQTPSCSRRDLGGQTPSSREDPADRKVHCVFVCACVQDNNVSMCIYTDTDKLSFSKGSCK